MVNIDIQLFLVVLTLPALFALVFIAEGIHKMAEKESPTESFILGFVFLGIIITAYFLLFPS
ncbi:hypothetical protein A2872_01450 [Candidatus Gottesmanbacteria bacterium RIFCSPHIGHO2_01_FULL_42_12]|uniref:Uncharacterized protein n=1 Tax=Candidatus Gottesmanbacteria bacterium RIFCSPHIGHO2_01_FULL_42_12 TaxID=1798377 RepID=A0A1F5Z4F2_9BACT|nr:MAG: hypothetical protein A2872_01450 [Candidatus Gottesmanbacteria bacterium RIFCSPHIGHO2_01_FULL_42_12]